MRFSCRPCLLLPVAVVAACASTAHIPAVPVDLSRTDLSRAERAAAATLGQPGSAGFRDMQGFALADGTAVVCGEMHGVDSFGADWGYAPIYVRMTPTQILRVHVDDTTDSPAPGPFPFNPATIGCTRAAEGLARG